jgi:hypothetical protein
MLGILVHGDHHFIARCDGEISSTVAQLLKELAQQETSF